MVSITHHKTITLAICIIYAVRYVPQQVTPVGLETQIKQIL